MEPPSNDADAGSVVLDFSGQTLTEMVPLADARPLVLIYDKNHITGIASLEHCEHCLEQLSLAENRLTEMSGVSRLHGLAVLNLANNGISLIEGLNHLTNLTWLNLSANNIKVMENLGSLVQLQHLDLSHNSITSVGHLTQATTLKTLLLHDNQLSSLKTFPRCLPHGLVILSLAQNHLQDLTEFAYIACFSRLGQLSLMDNPCVQANPGTTTFDYRPYVLNWCENLMVIDGYAVTEKERRQAVWLQVQGKGQWFKTGQHCRLTEYLGVACPLSGDTSATQDSSDTDDGIPPLSPKEPSAEIHGNHHARELVDQAIVQLQDHSEERHVQSTGVSPHRGNAWREGETVEKLVPRIGEDQHSLKDMQLEDVTSSDELTSLLEAETRYLPINSEMILGPLKPLQLGTLPLDEPHAGTHPEDLPERDTSSSSIPPSSGDAHQQESRYSQYENRPIKPLNQNRRIAANFAGFSPKMHAIKPQPSDSRPHCSRWSAREPVSTEVTLNSSDGSTTASSVTSDLKLLKDVLHSKRTKRSTGVRRSHSAHVHSDDAPKERVRSSVSSSLYKSEYSPDKYTTNRRSTRSRASGGSREYSRERRRDSGSALSRKGTQDSNAVSSEAETLAATKLQALWRGFRTRHRNPAVLQLKQELRDRRAEAHIRHLAEELSRQRRLYEEEKQLRHLQMDTLKYLWQQVQSLQTWKSEVLCSREELLSHKHLVEEVKSSQCVAETSAAESQSSQTRLTPTVMSVVQPATPPPSLEPQQQVSASRNESELETTCQSLQKQVSQLHEVLTSISNYVFQGGVISADQDDTGGSCDVRLSIDTEDQTHVGHHGEAEPCAGPSRCSASPTSPTSPARIPGPGIPSPPENLRIFQRTSTSGVLQWQASVIHSSSGKLSNKPIIGYRVYVNGCAKGMVAGTQRKALIEGLSRTNTYRLTVRAIAALGDSADSNVVIVHAESDDDGTHKSPPHDDDDDDDDPDKGPEKEPDNGNDGSPPGGDLEPSGGSTGGSRRSSRGSNAGGVTHEDGTTCLRGSVELSEWQHSPPGAPRTSSPNSRSQSELVCDADSGCWTSPVSSDKHSQVAPSQHKDDAKQHGRVGVSPDRQQCHLDAKQCDEQKSVLSVDEERVGSTALLSSSPRIQEALIKRLEVGRDKGMLVEMKMAAKLHKRKTGPEVTLPLKAVRNNTDSDTKLPYRNDAESTLGLVDELKDNDVPTAHSRIPILNCKRSNTSKVVDADVTVLNKDTVVAGDGSLSKARAGGSDDGKPVCRKTSIKRQSSLRGKRDGSSDREDGIDARTNASVGRRRGSVRSRSSSHSRGGSTESVTGAHVTDRVPRNDSEDSLSGRDSTQNSPSAKQKDASLDSSASGTRRLERSPQQNQLPARRDIKGTADSSAATVADDSELENVLLEASPLVPVPPPGVNTRQRRTSGSPMRRAERTAVSARLKEDGGSTRQSVDTVDTKHRPISWHVEQGSGDADTRSARVKIRTGMTEKRSCSVGAVDAHPEAALGVRLTQKPPVVKTVSRDVVGSRPTRRRAYSEHSSPARTVDTQQGSSPTSGQDVPTTPKTVRTHRRSRSDMSAIPIPTRKHPDSSTTPKDWKPVPPSAPKQALGSPRIRRSSSFSKATRGKGETDGQYTLRQCVSLEMLKAVKSKEAAAAAAAGCQATDQDVSPLRTASSDKASRGPTSRKLRSSQSFNLNRDEPRAEMGTSRARRSLTKTNSPKVSGASASSACPTHDKVTSKERRINLGTKAADLFAKLQQRLSANKS